jgi:hypothetical protein
MIQNTPQLLELLLEILNKKHYPKKPKKQKNKITKVKVQKNKMRKPKKLREGTPKTSPFQCDCEKTVGIRFKDYTCPKCNRLVRFDPKNPKPITPRSKKSIAP